MQISSIITAIEISDLQHPVYCIPAILRNEVGWFDDEENSTDILSMRLANDATFVRAAFSNRLSIFIQDTSAIFVALLLGMLLAWRVALLALATLPILVISAVAQVSSCLFQLLALI
jgi:ABC-type multidrug transport system fused ATPase/permease subunit